MVGGRVECPEDHFLTGLHCDGAYCDNLSMECTQTVARGRSSCEWTNERVSEEDGGLFLSSESYPGKYIAGIDCDDDYCDKKSFMVCTPTYN